MLDKRPKRLILLAAAVLVLITLGFGCLLNIASFKKGYSESLAAGYKVIALQGHRNIEYSVRYGKPLNNFLGMTEILDSMKTSIPEVAEVRVAQADGQILYKNGVKEKIKGEVLSATVMNDFNAHQAKQDRDFFVTHEQDKYHVVVPIRDKQGSYIGGLDMVFPEIVFQAHMDPYIWKLVAIMAMIVVLTIICTEIGLQKMSVISSAGHIEKKRLLAVICVCFGVAQLVYGVYSVSLFKTAYEGMVVRNLQLVAHSLAEDINHVTTKGISFDRLVGLEDYMRNVISTVPELDNMYITDSHGQVSYKTSVNDLALSENDKQHKADIILNKDKQGTERTLSLLPSGAYIQGKVNNIILDMATVGAIAFFLMYELVNLFTMAIKRKLQGDEGEQDDGSSILQFIRPVTFLMFIGTDMSLSFVPLHMKNLYNAGMGLSPKVAMGIPITGEMLFAGITTVIAGIIIDKKGWRLPFRIGIGVLSAGAILSGLAQNAYLFVVARCVVGVGYGLAWMALRGYIAKCPWKSGKAIGFSQFSAGILAGSACGCAFGAMLAERIGYSSVFFCGVALFAATAWLATLYLTDLKLPGASAPAAAQPPQTTGAVARMGKFLVNPDIVASFFLYIVPATICTVGFINYFLPVYFGEIGISTANTGRAYILYGICIIYFGPWAGKYIAKHRGEANYVILAGAMVALGLIGFSWISSFSGLVAVLFMLLIIGISESFGALAVNTFYLNLDATKEYGEGKALALSGLIRKIGQALGPVVFGSATVAAGANGVQFVGMGYLVLLAGFIYCIFLAKKQKVQRDAGLGG